MSKKESNQSPSHNQKNHTRPDFFGSSDNALRFLRWFCPTNLYESIEGDLLEQFKEDVKPSDRLERSDGYWERRAKRRLLWNVLKFFRPGIIFRNKLKSININQHTDMYKNYVISALRNIKRHKTISFINIFGLAICLSMGLIIILLIKSNFMYDTFHKNANAIYRINTKSEYLSMSGYYATSPPPLGRELLSAYPFIENAGNVIYSGGKNVLSGSQEIPVGTCFAENSYFEIFDFKIVAGDVTSWLTKPYSAVLSQKAAVKIFGHEDPLGKVINIEGWGEFTVTGLVANSSENEKSRFEREIYLSHSSIDPLVLKKKIEINTESWEMNFSSNTYLLLSPDAERADLDQALEQVSRNFARKMNTSDKPISYHFRSLRLNEIPPSDLAVLSGAPGVGMSTIQLFSFGGVALVFLLLAVFNYTNLTVARSFARSKEMGVRKITGASRSQIASQILTESILMASIAMIFAFVVVLLMPLPDRIKTDVNLSLTSFDSSLVVCMAAFAILAGIMAGFFPALIFSRVSPIQSLNNLLNTRLFRSLKARNVMIVIQFTVSIIFLAILFGSNRQANYEITTDLGYSRENLLTLNLHKAPVHALKAEIEKHASIVSTSLSSGPLGYNPRAIMIDIKETREKSRLDYLAADKNFIEIWGLTLLAGNNFPENISDSVEQFLIINEKAVATYNLGTPQEAIGQFISIDSTDVQIVGVVKDFHANNLKWKIEPLALRYLPKEFKCIMIKFQPTQKSAAIFHMGNVWKAFEKDFPIQLSVYDDEFNEHFSRPDDQFIMGTATLIAILTSCLGLLGVVLYSLETRTKEIAIRKVMGSSIMGLIVTLSKNFFMLMVISLCIGLPIGYLLILQFLKQFAYKIELNTNLGLFVATIVFAIGLLTICTQALHAALANPVRALKNN